MNTSRRNTTMKNRIRKQAEERKLALHQRKIAEQYAKELAKDERVAGTILLGGAARGYADEYSDIDITVFITAPISKLPPEKKFFEGFDADVGVLDLAYEKATTWSQEKRQAYSEGILLYDRDGEVASMLKEKLTYPEDERRLIIVDCIIKLGWMGVNPPRKKRWHGCEFGGFPGLWIKRGCLICAHKELEYAVELVLRMLYAYNRKFLPDVKWRLFRAFELEWLPKRFKTKIKRCLLAKAHTKREYNARLNVLIDIYHKLAEAVENSGILPKDLLAYYFAHSPEYYEPLHPEIRKRSGSQQPKSKASYTGHYRKNRGT